MRSPPATPGNLGVMTSPTAPEKRGLSRLLDRWLPSADDVEADELRERALDFRCSVVSDAPLAVPVSVRGTLRTVTLRPRVDVAALEAELYDGTGTLTLIWLGRRAIRGITPGRTLMATGRITRRHGHSVMFNPAYELAPDGH
jgi:hypothetical protein